MPTYSYEAILQNGEKITGNEVAASARELAQVLRSRGLVLVRSKQEAEKKEKAGLGDILESLTGVSLVDKLMFIRNLTVMVSAGIALPKALEILTLQTKNKQFRAALKDMREKVLQGSMLSKAMEAHPKVFSELFSNMVKVGEESGTLESVLSQLSLQLEKDYELRSKVQGALLYPAVIIFAMLGIGVLMLVLVVPKISDTFAELNITLPLTTRVVIGLANFLTQRWYVVLALLLGAGYGLFRFFKTTKGKEFKDALLFRLPVVSGIVLKTNAATTVRTLSSLIASGVPIVRSLEITSRVLGSLQFRNALNRSAQEVGKGIKLSASLGAFPSLYPEVVVQMVEVGEETGKSAEVLAKLAEFYEQEVANAAKSLASVVEPLLMLLVGAAVGFFAVSMIQPMYSILQTIQ